MVFSQQITLRIKHMITKLQPTVLKPYDDKTLISKIIVYLKTFSFSPILFIYTREQGIEAKVVDA